jgi:hypothetical protein
LRIIENANALKFVPLTEDEKIEIENAIPEPIGERYTGMQGTFESRLLV